MTVTETELIKQWKQLIPIDNYPFSPKLIDVVSTEIALLSIGRLEAKIAEALKELDVYCDGCSRFTKKVCTLKLPKSCQILKIRKTLAGENTK